MSQIAFFCSLLDFLKVLSLFPNHQGSAFRARDRVTGSARLMGNPRPTLRTNTVSTRPQTSSSHSSHSSPCAGTLAKGSSSISSGHLTHPLYLFLTAAFRVSAGSRTTGRFIVCSVEPGAFKDKTSPSRDKSPHFPSALRANFDGFILYPLELLKPVTAIFTLIFISGHFYLFSLTPLFF